MSRKMPECSRRWHQFGTIAIQFDFAVFAASFLQANSWQSDAYFHGIAFMPHVMQHFGELFVGLRGELSVHFSIAAFKPCKTCYWHRSGRRSDRR